MSKFEIEALIELVELLSSKNIERLKKKFIHKNFCEEDPPIHIDEEKWNYSTICAI